MMTIREQLEHAIDLAIEDAVENPALAAAVDDAIALLDEFDGDADFEGYLGERLDAQGHFIVHDPDLEIAEGPPLMDSVGYGHGCLAVYDRCPCCGRQEHIGYASPVGKNWSGQPEWVL